MLIDRRGKFIKNFMSSLVCESRTCRGNFFLVLGVHDFPRVVSQHKKEKTVREPGETTARPPSILFELLGNEKFFIHRN